MSEPGTPTFDQLQVFLSVVEAGSFAAAARRLNRATSAVTYAIDNLEAQLGMPLFDRVTTRKPTLTRAGRAILAEARSVSHGVDMLRAKAKGLLEGLEAEVSLVVDVMLPTARLVDALEAFQELFPAVTLRLHVETLGAVTQLVQDRTATVGITGPLLIAVDGAQQIEKIKIGSVQLIPVAAPTHPLAQQRKHAPDAARGHVQLVLTDRSNLTRGYDFGVVGTKTWRLADLGAKHALLLAGIGWGAMPEPVVHDDLAAGRLVALDLPDWQDTTYALQVIYRTDAPPGPAAQWLIERFESQVQPEPRPSGD
ncbi:LysR family transcriptional regulator [Telmatospirillum sp.]|uniref:LysR family transcriptional regulator n=1 Tax=Telmatospirillum sp. TaxID=2079197 RepID=UPI00283CB305|nr:LysR family transcriptional regulator [Telmatospirillum sp.]MDR3440157.1 LysR family transcriptional regulator [Telmatospirillum sp.]